MYIESMMSSNYLTLCCPFLLLPSIFSSIRVFSNQSTLHIRWPKYGDSASVFPMSIQGLISFRIDWLEKTLMLEKIEGRRRKGQQRVR